MEKGWDPYPCWRRYGMHQRAASAGCRARPQSEAVLLLYFAYGSNMDLDAMALRCPASRRIGLARLVRHRFALMREGYATVVRDPRRSVHGVLWDLSLRDVAALDRYEAVGSGLYGKIVQPVLTVSGPRRALVYVGSNSGPGRPLPGYMEAVVCAAEASRLPPGYIDELRQHLPRRSDTSVPARSRHG